MAFAWWLWLLFGIALLLVELITPGGFYFFFFGMGAVGVAVLAGLGMAGPPWMQWLLFGVFSVASLAVFRKPLQQRLRKNTVSREVDALVGEVAVALDEIGIQELGKAELRGTSWNAQNVGESAIPKGRRCRVERVKGLTLYIRG
jgi:inner membrane protein